MFKGKPQSFDGSKLLEESKDNPKIVQAKLDEMRWTRIMANDLENLPIGLIAAWGNLLCAYSPAVHFYLALTFAAVR